eukprot:GHVU01123425.1.p1 GENE.GHVU01123425.1~~GHVU01123425.1.p1  ORF type:complete len:110 (-),score=8.85 GHVU01123425.1:242-571(-)
MPEVPFVATFQNKRSYYPIERWAQKDADLLRYRFKRVAFLRRKYAKLIREKIFKARPRHAKEDPETGDRIPPAPWVWFPGCWRAWLEELEMDEEVCDKAQDLAGKRKYS